MFSDADGMDFPQPDSEGTEIYWLVEGDLKGMEIFVRVEFKRQIIIYFGCVVVLV